jgi:hypothetical protein
MAALSSASVAGTTASSTSMGIDGWAYATSTEEIKRVAKAIALTTDRRFSMVLPPLSDYS